MNLKLYRLYRLTWFLKNTILQKFTPAGQYLLAIVVISAILGLNTQKTMIYQLFALSGSLLLLSLIYSLRFTSSLTIERFLPETCMVGERLTYRLKILNHGMKDAKGLFFKEELQHHLPSYVEFINTPEDGEEKRNRFDRWAGYYRWLWMVKKNKGAEFEYQLLPTVAGRDQGEIIVHFTPRRRGYIHFMAYVICRHDSFGLTRAVWPCRMKHNLLVLPKIYPLPTFLFNDSRKHQQGGIVAALSAGNSAEFVALRGYRHGDPVKHIDWKSSARTGNTVVREYQDEYFSRYGLVLDTFTPRRHSQIFEEAVSVAASILTAGSMGETVLDLMFIGPGHFVTTSGQGIAEQGHLLEILASVNTCMDKSFADLAALIKSHMGLLSGLAIILIDMDQERQELLEYLTAMEIPFKAMLVVESKEEGEAKLNATQLRVPVTLLEVGQIAEGLRQL